MKNMKIRNKLFLGFAVVLVITIIIAVFGGNRIAHVNSEYSYALSYPLERFDIMHQLAWNLNESRRIVNRSVMYIFMPERIEAEIPVRVAALHANNQSTNDLIQAYIYNLNNDPSLDPVRRDELLVVIANYQAAIDHYADYYVANVFAAIRAVDGPAAMAAADAISGQIRIATEYYTYMMNSAANYMNTIDDELSAQTSNTIRILVVVAVVGVLAGVVVAIIISGAISKPIQDVSQVIESVSQGNLEINFRSNLSKDEVGVMTKNAYSMISTIKNMVDDIDKFVHENMVNGDIEYRIEADKYQGSYHQMLASFNTFIEDFTNGIVGMLNGLGEVNKGNFDTDIPDMPGKKMLMPNTFRATMANIRSVNDGLNSMIEAAAVKGDLGHTIDESKYEGGWRELMVGLNSIAKAVDAPLKVIGMALNEMQMGNFDLEKIEAKATAAGLDPHATSYSGAFKAIITDYDSAVIEIASYIKEISDTLQAIAGGDLTTSIQRNYVGSFSVIKESLNNISSSLNKTMSEISSASEQVLSGAKQISSSSMDLANGASTQASSIEELNASVDLINQQTKQNADNATKANTLSQTSTDNAREGNEAMTQTLSAMGQIKESSNNISKIIRTIQDIAFQTNLLALNAAVEAARAGEHGKGFAVVAEEVRSLAARSQQAASETTELIGTSISTVDSGSEIAQSTAETLNTIVDNANKVLDIVSNISVSSQEQAEAISQVVMGLQQISQVVQSNSAVSQEAAAASEELNSQAEVLQQLVAFFKL